MSNISKIYQNSEENNPNKHIYDIGAKFENVFLDDNNGYSLADLYEYLKDYFTKGIFSNYTTSEPQNQNIKVWFDTTVVAL